MRRVKKEKENTGPTQEQIDLHKKLNTQKYKWKVIADFLCHYHNVSDVPFIVPFGSRTYCYEPLRESKMTVEVIDKNVKFNIRTFDAEGQVITRTFTEDTWFNSPQPPDPFIHPVTKEVMMHDLNNVMLYSIKCKNYRLNVPIRVAPRLNFYHEGMAQLQQAREKDDMFEAAGAIRGAFTVLNPVNGGADMDDVPLPELHFAYQNQFFARTMAYVNDVNIMHGLVVIPHEVCLAADLPVWKGSMPEPNESGLIKMLESMKIDPKTDEGIAKKQSMKEQIMKQNEEEYKDALRITHFVAIPINHVLAWIYHSEEFAANGGHRVEQFRYVAAGGTEVILYYLIENNQFDSILRTFKRDWMGKVDMRPLCEAGFQFLPVLDTTYEGIAPEAQTVSGAVSLRAAIKFVSAPRLTKATIDNMAPALISGFPQCHEWSLDGVAQQIAIERTKMEEKRAQKLARKQVKK